MIEKLKPFQFQEVHIKHFQTLRQNHSNLEQSMLSTTFITNLLLVWEAVFSILTSDSDFKSRRIKKQLRGKVLAGH